MNRNAQNEELFNDIETNASELYILLNAIQTINTTKRDIEAFDAPQFVASGLMVSCKQSIATESLPLVLGEAGNLVMYLESLKSEYGKGHDVSGLLSMAMVRSVELVNDLECLEELA